MPILHRELVTLSRRGGLQAGRSTFAGLLLTIILGTFGAWYYQEGGHVSHQVLARIAWQSFLGIVAIHAMVILGSAGAGALSIAREKDRRTLDFVLATRLGNAEIVLGKLAACVGAVLTTLAAGLPVVLLLNLLGDIDLRLILLAYGGIASTSFFVMAVSIWISTGAPDVRRASSVSILCIIAWAFGPVMVPVLLPRLGLALPGLLFTANAWFLASSPVSVLMRFASGMPSAYGLLGAIAWMAGLQVAGGIVLLLGAIVRLRSGYRVNLGGDGYALGAAQKRPVWRLRPRPAVSDDPILWREKYTARAGFLGQLLGLLILLGIYSTLACCTFFFARLAFAELWRNGYAAGLTTAERPEFNLVIRFYLAESDATGPPDLARVDLNVFLRFVTTVIMSILALATAAIAAECIASERTRETWSSLIATPLTPRDILRGEMLACLWRLRGLSLTLLVLLTIGLLAGAIHPLGFFVSLLVAAAWTWLMLVLGMLASVCAKDRNDAANRSLRLMFLPIVSSIVPFLLPARMSSVLWGAGSAPFVTWLSLVSHRDVRATLHDSVYPPLGWIGIATGEGVISVVATCVLGIVAPALWGLWRWRYLIANFDRLVGRPMKPGCVRNPCALSRILVRKWRRDGSLFS